MKELKTKFKEEKKELKCQYKEKKQALIDKYNNNNNDKDKDNKLNETEQQKEKNDVPKYTKGEELFNMISHIVGGILGIVALIVTLIISISKHDGIMIFASIIYSLSLIILYTMSSIYHGLSPKLQKGKKIFRKFDHISIFLLIAGSYTVFLLGVLRSTDPQAAWTLFGVIWGATIIGTILNSINVKKFNIVSNIAFIAMGWSIIYKIKTIMTIMHPTGFLLLVFGGVAYTAGVIFYVLGRKIKYMHSIFHLFILAGSILHFTSIVGYVL